MTRQYPGPGRGRGRGRGGRVATPAVRVPTTKTLRSQSPSSARSGSSDFGSASPSPQTSLRQSRIITRREESPLSPSSFEVERTRSRSPSSSPSPKRAKSSRGKRRGGSVPTGEATKRGRDAAVSPVSKTVKVAQKEKIQAKKKKPSASPKKVARKAPPPRDDSVSSIDSRASTGNRSPPRARVSVAPARASVPVPSVPGRASVAAGRTSVVTNRPGPASKTGRASMTARTRTPSPPKKKTPTNKTKRQVDTPVFQKRYRAPPAPPKIPKSILEIQFYQRSTDFLIPLASFTRLVKEITVEMTNQPDLRYKVAALQALQAASEGYLIGLFEDSNLITMHSRRVTLYPKDLRLAYRIRGDNYRY